MVVDPLAGLNMGLGSEKKEPPDWNKHYVAGLFNEREKKSASMERWKAREKNSVQGWDICRDGIEETQENRRHFVRTIYYPNYVNLIHQGKLMIPEILLHGNFVWGSLAYTSFPGSSIDVYTRAVIEEALNTLPPAGCTMYLTRRESKFNKGMQYGYFVLPIEEMLGRTLQELRIPFEGTKNYRVYCPDGVPNKFLGHVPSGWLYPDENPADLSVPGQDEPFPKGSIRSGNKTI